MERKLQQTADGSHTLYIPELDEHYHSVNGALREAEHIFIEAGLRSLPRRELRVLEIGFGTGLNAFLTWKEAEQALIPRIDYYTVELYPLPLDLARRLNYGQLAWPGREERFLALHEAGWGVDVPLSERFVLHKIQGDSNTVCLPEGIDLVYFDAFAPDKQPEMWNQAIYDRLYACVVPGGIIVTYCAKGEVRRGMQAAGFKMSRLPGPPGKRHMLKGIR